MIEFDFEIIKDNTILNDFKRTKKGANKVDAMFRRGMKQGIVNWHKKNIATHFSKKAYGKYSLYKNA